MMTLEFKALFNFIFFLLILLIGQKGLDAQIVSSLETGSIVELECAQSAKGTFIAVTMERPDISLGNGERVHIHRSVDHGDTWDLIQSFIPDSTERVVDPVIAIDDAGQFYLIFMRVRDPRMTRVVDLELYKSKDDGITWEFVGYPHFNDFIADYPQLIAKGDGQLYLVYTHIMFSFLERENIFKKSTNGGESWAIDTILTPISQLTVGPDIAFGGDQHILVSAGLGEEPGALVYESKDDGKSWLKTADLINPRNEEFVISKPLSHPDYSHFGVIVHRPHVFQANILYHTFANNSWTSQEIGKGAYAQGVIDDLGGIHIIYNQTAFSNFQMKYIYSRDKGLTFSQPITLYSKPYTNFAQGEYQSLIIGDDNLFYITFCDWSDHSRAKMLVFDPGTLNSKDANFIPMKVFPNPANDILYVQEFDFHHMQSLRLCDLNGKTLIQKNINNNPSISLDLSHISSGQFILILEGEGKVLVSRFIKR